MKRIKKDKKRSEKKENRRIYKSVIFWLIIGFGIATILSFVIAHCILIKNGTEWLKDAADWIALIVGGLGAIATAELGYVAIWQNRKATEISQRMLDVEEREKHSFLYIKRAFTYLRSKMEGEFLKKSHEKSANYFIAKNDNWKSQEYYEKIVFHCVVQKWELNKIKISQLKYIGEKENVVFSIDEEVNANLVYDIEEKESVVEIVFLTDHYIYDSIKSNIGYWEIEFEYENIYKMRDKRMCEVNFFDSFQEHKGFSDLDEKEKLCLQISSELDNVVYRNDLY